tara:strand:+ start:194 stop:643 length:450 start_codon:yes stop_codon:yes gene_type:complete
MDGLSTLDIDEKLKIPSFLGAFPYDELPQKPDGDFSVIVNTEPSTEPGDHWLPIIFKKGTFYFLDSFGRSPRSLLFTPEFKTTVKEYMLGHRRRCNSKLIQYIFSNTCAYYSIYFIREMQSKSMAKTMEIFTDNLKNNDLMVTDIVNNY